MTDFRDFFQLHSIYFFNYKVNRYELFNEFDDQIYENTNNIIEKPLKEGDLIYSIFYVMCNTTFIQQNQASSKLFNLLT